MSSLSPEDSLSEKHEIDAKVIGDLVSISILKPTYGKTFRDYAINVFATYIRSLLRQTELVDLLWDRYFAESLKNCTREKRRT